MRFAILACICAVIAIAAFQWNDASYDRDEFLRCMEDPPISGVERAKLLKMPFWRIEMVCDCHAGAC